MMNVREQTRLEPIPATGPFDQLVFAGGGTRCFWQGGFLDVLRRKMPINPARISSVSGGALAAACFFAQKGHELLDVMTSAFAEEGANATVHDLSEGKGLTPHQRIYRDVVTEVLGDDAVARIAEGPVFQVLLAHPAIGGTSRVAGLMPGLVYEAELHLRSRPHLRWPRKFGLEANLVDARQAAREGQLVDLICAAAAIPPLFDLAQWNDRPVLDAGMADQAPMPKPCLGRTLILLTRRYRHLPRVQRRFYVQPHRETPADKIDFTDPKKLRRTWDLGRNNARSWLASCTGTDEAEAAVGRSSS